MPLPTATAPLLHTSRGLIDSDVLSELPTKRVYFLLDIVDFGKRPEPRSSKYEFWTEQFQSRKSWISCACR